MYAKKFLQNASSVHKINITHASTAVDEYIDEQYIVHEKNVESNHDFSL